MKRSGVLLRGKPDRGLQDPKYGYGDGWSKSFADHPAIPGVGVEHVSGNRMTTKSMWFQPLGIPHTGHHMDVVKRRPLADGPEGSLTDTVADAAGLPSSTDALAAAKWKVQRLARVDPDYTLTAQSQATTRRKPKVIACSAPSAGTPRPSLWKNYLNRISGSIPDPLVRDIKDQRTFAPSLHEHAKELAANGEAFGQKIRSQRSARPWEVNRDIVAQDEPQTKLETDTMKQQTDSHQDGINVPATAIWIFAWMNEWDTQIKVACPWDTKLVVHRCTAELPWVLEQQWNSPEAAKELVKDCIEDFHDMCKKKGYIGTTEAMPAVVCLNGFWLSRRGVIQGLNDMRSKITYTSVADISPIPVHEVELLFPRPADAPKVALFGMRIRAFDHQAVEVQRPG
ncbi:hypothetical protein DIPPA_34112 [Diplonema papillatum]|nr:hypothetical protein DIPPA_34112 [Diplonema papillatum]